MINLLNSLVEDFWSKTKAEAPGGALMQTLQNIGPAVHPIIIALYTAWLQQNGYTEAAAEWWAGLKTPIDRVIKPLTAMWKEAGLPGAEIIPAGGFEPISVVNPWIRGGDVYTQRRAVQALKDMYQAGKITAEEYQQAAATHAGPVWEQALQAEALKTGPSTLGSWATGLKVKETTPSDQDMLRMWHDLFALPAKGSVADSVYQQAQMAFKAKYPWADTLLMGRESNPQARLDDYAGLVLDRLNPGRERAAALAAAGLPQALLDKYYAAKYSTATMTPDELAIFQAAINKLAGSTTVPTAEQEQQQGVASAWHQQMLEQAARLVQQQGYNFTLDQLRAIEAGYSAEGTDTKAYLAAHPELKAYWDAKRTASQTGILPKLSPILQDAGVGPGQGLTGTPGVTPQELRASEESSTPRRPILTPASNSGMTSSTCRIPT